MTWNAKLYSKDIIPNLSSFHTALPVKFMVMKYHAVGYCKFPSKLWPGNSPGKPRSGHGIQKPGCGKSLRRLLFQDILPRSQHTCHKRRHTEAREPWTARDGRKKVQLPSLLRTRIDMTRWPKHSKTTKQYENNMQHMHQKEDTTKQNNTKHKKGRIMKILSVQDTWAALSASPFSVRSAGIAVLLPGTTCHGDATRSATKTSSLSHKTRQARHDSMMEMERWKWREQ